MGRCVTAGCAIAVGCAGTPIVSSNDAASDETGRAPGDAAGDGVEAGDAARPPEVDISGRWAMFVFEDPVAIEVVQSGGRLSGRGCYGGLDNAGTCSPLVGMVEGLHVRFSFVSSWAPYAADVFASSDGQRMAGSFHDVVEWTSSFSWLRIGAADPWLPETPSPVSGAVASRPGTYVLQPVGAAPTELEIVRPCDPAACYQIQLANRGAGAGTEIGGTVGAFWATEMTWREADQTLVAGPVPPSSPGVPVQLSLAFDGPTLSTVQATMPSGHTYTFMATPP